jgi:hypothetical protein
MNTEIAEALGIKADTFGIVIFYQPNRAAKTITEIGRTPELPFSQAIDIYSETPNPASQLLQWTTEDEKAAVLAQHALDIKDPEWLEYLFDCI